MVSGPGLGMVWFPQMLGPRGLMCPAEGMYQNSLATVGGGPGLLAHTLMLAGPTASGTSNCAYSPALGNS